MKTVIRFKVLSAPVSRDLEHALNLWAESLPPGTKIRRTQLAGASDGRLVALINYEVQEPEVGDDDHPDTW